MSSVITRTRILHTNGLAWIYHQTTVVFAYHRRRAAIQTTADGGIDSTQSLQCRTIKPHAMVLEFVRPRAILHILFPAKSFKCYARLSSD
jgi:hypothetical protein